MKLTVRDIATIIEGKVIGNKDEIITDVAKIEEGQKGKLSFLANSKYEHYIYETNSSVVIVDNNFEPKRDISCSLIKVEDPYQAFAKLLSAYEKKRVKKESGIHPSALIHEDVHIDDSCYIGPYVIIEKGTKIGKNVTVGPHSYIGENVKIDDGTCFNQRVTIHHECSIGKNCVIHSGTVIGGDGFGFAPSDDDYKKIPQIGNVVIDDNVEIGSNCTIDRATMGSTYIRKGAKLDNLIQIAHNVEIGENTVIAAQAGISGSVKIGKNNMLGGQVGISGHIFTADNVKIGAQSGVAGNIKQEGVTLLGSPAFEIGQYKKSFVYFKNLKSLYDRILKLENAEKKKS